MAASSANLTSIESVRTFRAALATFADAVRDALMQMSLEARRPQEWLEHEQMQYWPREIRKADSAVAEARLALDRCQITVAGDDHRWCIDERKALARAKRRLEVAEQKLAAVRKWRMELAKEIENFEVQREKLVHSLDYDLPRAMAALERMAAALDRYVESRHSA